MAARPIALALHGGCGTLEESLLSPGEWAELRDHLAQALRAGWTVIAAGGRSLDAVEAAVVVLEDSPHFNAGHGAALTAAATHELDASIMDGASLAAGGMREHMEMEMRSQVIGLMSQDHRQALKDFAERTRGPKPSE